MTLVGQSNISTNPEHSYQYLFMIPINLSSLLWSVLDRTLLNYLIERLQSKSLGETWSTTSLPLLPGRLWPEMVAPFRILFMGKIEVWNLLCVQTNDLC